MNKHTEGSPLVAGGQGRSARDISDSFDALVVVGLFGFAVALSLLAIAALLIG